MSPIPRLQGVTICREPAPSPEVARAQAKIKRLRANRRTRSLGTILAQLAGMRTRNRRAA